MICVKRYVFSCLKEKQDKMMQFGWFQICDCENEGGEIKEEGTGLY